MIPQVVKLGPLAAPSANNIALSQSAAGAQALTINGSTAAAGVATLDTARRVLITSAGNDSGITFRITGTNLTGNPIRETLTGANATTTFTLQDYLTVTEIMTSAATAAAVTVGTNGIASGPWKFTSILFGPANMSFAVVVSGTVNYTIEVTYDNPNSNQNVLGSPAPAGNYPAPVNVFKHPVLQALTASDDGATDNPIFAWRITLNSQTNPGFVTATGIQSGTTNQR